MKTSIVWDVPFDQNKRVNQFREPCSICGMPYHRNFSDDETWGIGNVIEWECGTQYRFGYPDDRYFVSTACAKIKELKNGEAP